MGRWGELAYWYYKAKGDILFYVDISPSKVGKKVVWCDLIAHPIEDLNWHRNAMVIVAVAQNEGIQGLLAELGIVSSVVFHPNMLYLRNAFIMSELNKLRSIDWANFCRVWEKSTSS